MKLPDTVLAHGIPPDAEYDAMFSMPPKKLARMFADLVADKSNIVVISIAKFEEKNDVTFIKERDPNTESDSDDEFIYPFLLHANDLLYPENVNVVMEDRIEENGIEKRFCMTCLHDYLDRTFIEFPNATQVTMYMAADETLPTFMFHTVPGGDNKEYYPDAPDHRYHESSEKKAVRKRPLLYLEKIWPDENVGVPKGGDGKGNDNADGEGSGNKDGKEYEEWSPTDGDGKGTAEIVPKDGDGEMIPNDGDGDGKEVNAEDAEGELAKKNADGEGSGNGDGKEDEELDPNNGDGKGTTEIVPKDGDGEMIPNDGVGDGKEVNAEDGERELAKENADGEGSDNGDGKEDEELAPNDGDGKGTAEIVPKDGDVEMIPNDGDGEMIPNDGDGEMIPNDGDGEMIPKKQKLN